MSLVRDFNLFPSDQLSSAEIIVKPHPTKPLILVSITGTAVMMALAPEEAWTLVDALAGAVEKLKHRTLVEKRS